MFEIEFLFRHLIYYWPDDINLKKNLRLFQENCFLF